MIFEKKDKQQKKKLYLRSEGQTRDYCAKIIPHLSVTFSLYFNSIILQIVRLDFCLSPIKDEIQFPDSSYCQQQFSVQSRF